MQQVTYKAVLFDLEGTLVDFQWQLERAAEEIKSVLTHAGIDLGAYGRWPDYAGLFNTTADITSSWPEPERKKLFKQLDRIYDTYDSDALSRWQIYPDTRKTLKALSADDCRMGTVSNCGHAAAFGVLDKFSLVSFFEVIITRNDVSRVKPHPEGLLKALEHLGLEVDDVLFVGDSTNDILPAREIGMDSCFLSNGESLITKDIPSGATYSIETLNDLLSVILK